MTKLFSSLADKMADTPPAHVAEYAPLFEWAKDQAAAVRVTKDRIAEKRNDLATVTETVEESMEFKDVEDCREALKKARDAAIERDADVLSAKEALADARKELAKVASFKKQREIKGGIKALETVCDETKDRLAHGLATGKVPSAVEMDPKVAKQD